MAPPWLLVLLLAVPLGVLIGLSLGALGGGGSILTVPALVYVLGQNAHGATTASLVVVGLSALVGMAGHLHAGRVDVRLGVVFGILGVGGSYVGSRLSARIDPNLLLAAFSVLIAVAAVSMLRRLRRARMYGPAPVLATGADPLPWDDDSESPDGPGGFPGGVGTRTGGSSVRSASPVKLAAAATVVGLLTGFFGVGGGFVVVPALVLAVGLDMQVAVGTSLLVIAINSASALLARLGTHSHVDVALIMVFTAAAMFGALAGNRVVSRTRTERLVHSFALLLVLVAVYTAARSLPHLL